MGSSSPILPVHASLSTSPSGSPDFPENAPHLPSPLASGSHVYFTRSRPHYQSNRTSTSLDSQQEVRTAVNTPPHISRHQSGSRFVEGDSEKDWTSEAGDATLHKELELRAIASSGEEKHGNLMNGKGGAKEKKQTLDLDHGFEEVSVIEWPPGDPDVSLPCYLHSLIANIPRRTLRTGTKGGNGLSLRWQCICLPLPLLTLHLWRRFRTTVRSGFTAQGWNTSYL